MLCGSIGSIHCVSVTRPTPVSTLACHICCHFVLKFPKYRSSLVKLFLNMLIVLASFIESGGVYQNTGAS